MVMSNYSYKLNQFPPRIIMGINDGYCNLKCPMCLVHGEGSKNTIKVPMCGVDVDCKTNMGNVFKDGIKGVWLGKKFQEIHYNHETGQFSKLYLCNDCDVWKECIRQERKEGDVIIRESPLTTYYNKADRL